MTDPNEEIAARTAGLEKATGRSIADWQAIVRGFGTDKHAEIAPKQTMVMIRRSKGFACFTPSSAKRAEVGIALRGDEPTERLRASKGMTSHAVWIEEPGTIDDEVIGWLRAAYERS